MINLQEIIISNASAVLLLVMLLASTKKTLFSAMTENVLFLCMVGSAALQAIVETLSFMADGVHRPGFHAIVIFLNTLLYVNNICFAFIWTVYIDYKMDSGNERRNMMKKHFITGIPCAIIVVACIVNIFTSIFFSVDSANVYHREQYFFIPCIVSYLYLLYSIVMVQLDRKKGNRYMFLPVMLFMFPILIGGIAQFVFYGISIVWICSAISLASLFVNIQNEMSCIDAMSGMFTRQYMNRFLSAETHKGVQKRQIAGIMIDIDCFKKINDTFGHITGDDAISSTGVIIRSCIHAPNFGVRFAGDEFVIIVTSADEQKAIDLIKKIRKRTESFNEKGSKVYRLEFSIGYTLLDRDNDTVDSFIDRMDKEMYLEKNEKKTKSGYEMR